MYYESYEQIAAIFLDTADYEKEQAKVFFKLLEDGETLEITSAFHRESLRTPRPSQDSSRR
jgi:rubrerythrin